MATKAWGGVEYGVTGDAEIAAQLVAYARQTPAIALEELTAEATIELQEAVRRAPLDTDPPRGDTGGELRESGRVAGPIQTEDGFGVAIAFGGPDVPYAIAQHQKYHPHVEGQREYLIDTIDASKRHLGQRLARRLGARLGQVRA